MRKVQLVAVKPLRYATRALRAGDAFVALRKDAELLKRVGLAADAPVTALPAPKSGRQPPPETPDPDAFLRVRYSELSGMQPDKRWGAARLQREIDALTNPPPPAEVAEVDAPVEPPAPDAGGDDENGPLI